MGVDRYYAEVLPHDKGNYVKQLQKEKRKVAFVGDGINDSIALKRADISISLRGASSLATDTSQIVLMDGGLYKLNNLMDHASYLKKNVRQSWSMIAVSNTICIAGALFGFFGLAASLIMNNGVNFIATINGVRPLWKVNEQV
jgi:Cu2+-exporting ATPase